jgi:parallel beta-helix repeat protein
MNVAFRFKCSFGFGFILLAHCSFAQGPLTPPGAPAPTMKTLDQLEPRIPLTMNTAPGDNAYQFIIAHAGSYYLTTNLIGLPSKSAIRILTNDVDLNLNGYSVTGVSNSIGGVTVAFNVFNVSIRHGTVRDWGNSGINAGAVQNGVFEDLLLFGNGTAGVLAGYGLNAGTNSLVRNCQAWGNSSYGIGMDAGGLVIECLSRSNSSVGIATGPGGVIRGCVSSFNSDDGIVATDNCLIVDNNSYGNRSGGTKAGIHLLATGGGTRIENNNVSGNDYGISVSGNGNFIVRNSAHSNATNYNIGGTNTVGPIVTNTGVITTNSPWANFSY